MTSLYLKVVAVSLFYKDSAIAMVQSIILETKKERNVQMQVVTVHLFYEKRAISKWQNIICEAKQRHK